MTEPRERRSSTDTQRGIGARVFAPLRGWRGGGPRTLLAAASLSVIVGMGAALSIRTNYLLRHDRERVVHSLQVMRAADQILMGLIDAETGQRGFLITDDPAFLVPYEQAVTRTIPESLHALEGLVSDSPAQSARAREIRVLADQKLAELSGTLLARQREGVDGARALFANGRGKDVMDRLRMTNRLLQEAEETLLAGRSAEVQHDEQRIILIIILVATLSTTLRLALAAWRQRVERREFRC